ncbi:MULTISPECIES: RNA polymerase sigma factor [Psychrobacillus]|uniref:RNA polymerase sigma factor n=1 Tax=Psychrobacillus faecigallinarum TaxID=2762235 RepID=A0ABR8RAU1_9BACI|nr:RNA polymerase sigma factor [Psychrobacillus faecigallinarum]MBD7944908.1 RNA polymerase sigma factor [Psychrobacillus faecigallinarum]
MDFEEIYQAYFHDVYLYTRSLAIDENIAEEITQETFFKALRSMHQFDGKKDIRAWLFTIAKNTYFTHYNKKQREVNQVEVSVPDDVRVVEYLVNEEQAFEIHHFLHTMEEPYKEVFSLRTFGELSFEKIGQLFGKSDGWARVTFYRAKKKILAYMEAKRDEGS